MRFVLLSRCIWLATLNGMACAYASPWILNNPYPKSESAQKIYYSSFNEQPKTLDPARAYSSNEYLFIGQIYEPLLEYDYFIRPFQLIPLTASRLPEVRYLDKDGMKLPDVKGLKPAYTVYTLHIKKGIVYQPHPALAKNKQGLYRYHHLSADFLDDNHIASLADFKNTGTRELHSDDYIYQIKRLANPQISSSIYGLMSDYIVGFADFAKTLPKEKLGSKAYIDLRDYPLTGVKKIDDYAFEITIKGQYAQFLFWLAMPFFAPVPWEADLFYAQEGMADKNLSLDWYPIGTGAFLLLENNPNKRMILAKNPNYRRVLFPVKKEKVPRPKPETKTLPLIDKAIYTLEKESIPRWNKFLQGYYDVSGISADSFDQAIHINPLGRPVLSKEMRDKKMSLIQTLDPGISYMGFNMLDPIVGGYSKQAQALRQAISIAVNYDEYISIFFNGRGRSAQGPIPPGIFGYAKGKEGMNPYVYRWVNDKAQRKSLDEAKTLMIKAGYPQGIDPKTGRALILHYDVSTTGGPQDKALLDWMRKQFATLGIDLDIRATLYNRFQEKMRTGNAQIFTWGWSADYPDPENFLFQLYSPNAKVTFGGENAANYANPEFDRLYELMKNRANDAERRILIDKMLAIVREDAPWVWGMHPEQFTLTQSWLSDFLASSIYMGTLKYIAVDVGARNTLRQSWNQPVLWPLALFVLLLCLLIAPVCLAYFKKEQQLAKRMPL